MGIFNKVKEELKSSTQAFKEGKEDKLNKDTLFKKQQELNEKQKKNLEKIKENDISNIPSGKNYDAIVRLVLPSGSNLEEFTELGANISLKEGKHTLKVVNKDNEVIFEQVKPDWQNKFKYLDKLTLEQKIKDIKQSLKEFQSGTIEQKKDKKTGKVLYEEDYLAMLRQAEQDYAILTLGTKGTYSSFKAGIPIYTFEIMGSYKIPIFHYTDKSILGLPPASKLILGDIMIDMAYKNRKANETRAERIIMTIFALAMGLALIGSIAILWKVMAMVGDTASVVEHTSSTINGLMNMSDYFHQLINNTDLTNSLLAQDHTPLIQNKTSIIN